MLHVTVSGTGPPLVLLHGFTGSAANWDRLRPALERRYTVVALDLLGHGHSPSPVEVEPYTMAACVRDVVDVLTHLALPPVTLLGYSMGGRVALSVAAAHPARVQRLILESASPGLADPAERMARVQSDAALATQLEQRGLEWFVDYWENIPLFASQKALPAATRARLRAQRLHNNPQGLANSLRGLSTGAQPALWERLPTLTVPTLLITGALDAKFTTLAQQMAHHMPNATHVIVPNAGHTVHLEQAERFVACLGVG